MIPFPIVDAHVHFWDPEALRYQWLANEPRLNRPYLPRDYWQDCSFIEVEHIVFVQCEGEPALREVEWVTALTQAHPQIAAIVARAPIEIGLQVEPHLAQLQEHPQVRGVRRLIQDEPDKFCLQPKFIDTIRLLERYDLSFDVCVYHHQLKNIIQLVEQCPGVQFVLDHLGKPDAKNQQFDRWSADVTRLSQLENVHCKLSGLVTEADHQSWRPEELTPYIRHALDSFGFDRVMYGSDWPVVRLASDVDRWLKLVWSEVRGCSDTEQSQLFRGNATRVYRLPDAID